MEKLTGKTADILSENIEKIRQFFPEAFIEGKIDFDMLQKILRDNIETERERYGFTWHGKSDAIKMALKQTTGTLRPKKADSKHWDTTQNLFIEGDNLEVLRALQESYRSKIKMIYIDPPYNTGRDFVYEDNFSDNIKNYKEKVGDAMQANADTSGRYHTNWLNMMYPRLRLAKNLLKDDGVIFISIDDNELHNLRKLCDEIFGEENFIACVIWKRKRGRDNSARWFSKSHEFLLVYAKTIMNFDTNFLELDEETKKAYKNPDNDPRGIYRMLAVWARGTQGGVEYDFTDKHGQYFQRRLWLFSKENLTKLDRDDKLIVYRDNIYRKLFINENKGKIPETIWDNASNAANASDEIKSIFGSIIFDTPKPIPYIAEMLKIASGNNDMILDFFAGSATTAHAVMQLNAEDGGNRKFIMVQIPEPTSEDGEARKAGYSNIAEIGKERIHRAGEMIKHKVDKKFDTSEPTKDRNTKSALPVDEKIKNLDIGFKVFELDETNFKLWDPNTKDIERSLLDQLSPLKEERTDEDAVFEILLKYGIDLTTPVTELNLAGKKVFSLEDGYLLICLEKKIELDTVREMAKLSPKRVVFYDDGFLNDTVKANAEQTLKKAGAEEIMVI